MVLMAGEPTPPPLVESPPPLLEAPPPLAAAPPRAEADIPAQTTFVVFQTFHGGWLGLNTCAALGCVNNGPTSALPISGVVGAGAGFGLSFFNRNLARDWGRSALLTSVTVASALAGLYAWGRLADWDPQARYAALVALDLAATGGALWVANGFSPRPESVWLTDTAAMWGALLGILMLGVGAPPSPALFPDAAVLGGLLAATATGVATSLSPRVTGLRFLASNGLAFLGGLVVGGSLALVQAFGLAFRDRASNTVPVLGLAAGIAGGFALGFALTP